MIYWLVILWLAARPVAAQQEQGTSTALDGGFSAPAVPFQSEDLDAQSWPLTAYDLKTISFNNDSFLSDVSNGRIEPLPLLINADRLVPNVREQAGSTGPMKVQDRAGAGYVNPGQARLVASADGLKPQDASFKAAQNAGEAVKAPRKIWAASRAPIIAAALLHEGINADPGLQLNAGPTANVFETAHAPLAQDLGATRTVRAPREVAQTGKRTSELPAGLLEALKNVSNQEDVRVLMRAQGYTSMGTGFYATVWAKDDDNFVLKISWVADKGYQAFLKVIPQAKAAISRHFPKIFERHLVAQEKMMLVRMERLNPIDAQTQRAIEDYLERGVKSPNIPESFWQSLDFVKSQPAVSQPGIALDLHGKNIMRRSDGTLVIIDPYDTPFWK